MYKVSIVIPIYNVEKYLARCLDSVVNQTLKEIQIILVDDGSTDNSAEIYSEYKNADDRITVIKKENGGVASARTAGAAQIKGEYVLSVDSDDYIAPDMAETLYNAAKESNSEVAICGYCIVSGDTILKTCPVGREGVYCNDEANRRFIFSDAVENAYVWNKLVKSELYLKNLRYCDSRLVISEDLALSAPNVIDANCIAYVDKNLYFYRRSEIQTTGGYKETTFDSECLAEQKAMEAAKDAGLDLAPYIKKRYVMFAFWQIAAIRRSVKNRKTRRREIKKWCKNRFYYDVDKSGWSFRDKLKFRIVKGGHAGLANWFIKTFGAKG